MGQLSTANLVFGTKHDGGSRKTRSNKGIKRGSRTGRTRSGRRFRASAKRVVRKTRKQRSNKGVKRGRTRSGRRFRQAAGARPKNKPAPLPPVFPTQFHEAYAKIGHLQENIIIPNYQINLLKANTKSMTSKDMLEKEAHTFRQEKTREKGSAMNHGVGQALRGRPLMSNGNNDYNGF
tara:strand:+ start:1623 stop:2156 length:534 start_codon:yes stop_codon:yes gene_type:complete